MKKTHVVVLLACLAFYVPAFSQAPAVHKISISLTHYNVSVDLGGAKVMFPQFTPGNHHPDSSLSFRNYLNGVYAADWPEFRRGYGSGNAEGIFIYHLSSGPVVANTSDSLLIKVSFPAGYALAWHGKVWKKGQAELAFRDYFIAREFPLFLIPEANYFIRPAALNKIDTMQVIYAWTDTSLMPYLPDAIEAVDSAVQDIGLFAPNYWHKFLQNYDKAKYTLVYILNRKVVTGLEHVNSPYSMTVPAFIREDAVCHTLLHSFIGKSLVPQEYIAADGRYHPSDALGLYEGLTTFLANRYVRKDFAAYFSAAIYRAKLEADNNDLTKLAGSPNETYYSKGYLFWVYMQLQGFNVDLYSRTLFSLYCLPKSFPVKTNWADVLRSITIFNPKYGPVAEEAYKGKYLETFSSLMARGWSPIPVREVPRWYDLYIGPYPVIPGGVQLPTDQYPMTEANPVTLILEDKEMAIKPEKDNPALRLIKENPYSFFNIRFSDGKVISVKDRLLFQDGWEYFMHGRLQLNYQNIGFWRTLNLFLEL